MEAMSKLDDLVDESDPDCDVPNVFHAYQLGTNRSDLFSGPL